MEQEVLNLLSVFMQQDGSLIQKTEEIIRNNSENQEFGKCLINLNYNDKISMNFKLLSLIVYERFNIVGFDEIVQKLTPIISSGNQECVYYAARIIGKMIKTDEELFRFLNMPVKYANVVIIIIKSFFDTYELITESMIKYLIFVINENLPFELKNEAALCLYHCFPRVNGAPSEQIHDLNERLYIILKNNLPLEDIFSMTLTPENADFIKTFIKIGHRLISKESLYNICLGYLRQTAEYLFYDNFPDYNKLSKLIILLCNKIEFILLSKNELAINITELAELLVLNSVLSNESINSWNDSIESFVKDNVFLDDDDDDLDYFYNSHQNACIFLLQYDYLVDPAINFCKNIYKVSPKHQEAAFHVLSQILPKDHIYDFTINLDFDDPIIKGRYMYSSAILYKSIDNELIEEAINSEGYILPIFAALTLIDVGKSNEYIVPVFKKLLPMIYNFETGILQSYISIFTYLISIDPFVFSQDFTSIVDFFLQILPNFYGYPIICISIIELISTFRNVPNATEYLIETCFPAIISLLKSFSTAETGIDLLESIVIGNNSFNSAYIQYVLPIYPYFVNALTSFPLPLSKSFFTLFSFFVTNHDEPVLLIEWLIHIIDNKDIESKEIKCLASCSLPIFNRFSSYIPQLIVSLFNRITYYNSISYTVQLVTTISTFIFVDKEKTFNLIQLSGLNISTILSQLSSTYSIFGDFSLFEQKLFIYSILSLGPIEINYDDEPKPIQDVAVIFYLIMINSLLSNEEEVTDFDAYEKSIVDESISFIHSDPFYSTHQFRSLLFSEYSTLIFPDPPSFIKQNLLKLYPHTF